MNALQIAGWVPCTGAEGPHLRFALWVQGCSLACPGCCNPGMWARTGGRLADVAEIVAAVREARANDDIEGITLVGGEPLEQMAGVTALARAVAAEGLGVIVFTGLELTEARERPGFGALWTAVDTLVDGRYVGHLRERGPSARRFVGSRNQRLVHRTERYADAALWQGAPTAELVVGDGGRLRIVGDPSVAAGLARRVSESGARP